jgi:DNA-binding NarL/FixJ family response regulator
MLKQAREREAPMHVLLIEDHSQLAGLVSRELHEKHGYETDWECDPIRAREKYRKIKYDIAIIDLLYGHLSQDFEDLRRNHMVTATSRQLLITGLMAAQELTAPPRHTKIVIWTSGEANRRLHILYAYEELGIRVFCSKSSGGGTSDTLVTALGAAAQGRTFIDPVLNSYLPAANSPTVRETILRESSKRAIWRAVALGARTRGEISDITGYSNRTIGNLVPAMLDDLIVFDPGISRNSPPMAQLISYASRNWEFFLDEMIRTQLP